MRIAVVHSFYSAVTPSGENQVVQAQVDALREAGHEVLLIAQHTDTRGRKPSYPLEAAFSVATGIGPAPLEALQSFQPDVVHVHNLFPNFGTTWLQKWRGPVVATLHNFRPLCAAGTLFRDGDVCMRCPDGDRRAALRYGCYRDSRIATAPLAWRNRRGVNHDPVIARADALVVLSERAWGVYEWAGVDGARLRVVPNFVEDPFGSYPGASSNGRWLFAGRLTPEKGVLELVNRWPADQPLDVIGDGPLLEKASARALGSVSFLGRWSGGAVRSAMPDYLGLVVASRCFENLPTVYLEALAAGLPVVAFEGNSVADDVAAQRLGVVLPREASRESLATALHDVWRAGRPLRTSCRSSFAARFTAGAWVAATEHVYTTATGVRV